MSDVLKQLKPMLLLALFFFSISAAWSKDTRSESPQSFHLFFHGPSLDRNTKAHLVVDGGEYKNPQEMSQLAERFVDEHGEEYLPRGEKATIELVVVVPKNAPESYIVEFTDQIRKQFESQLGKNSKIKVRRSYVDVDKALWELNSSKEFLQTEMTQTNDPVQIGAMKSLLLSTLEQERELQTWRNNWFTRKLLDPINRQIAAYSFAVAKAGIAITFVFSRYGFNWGSGLIATIAGSVTATFGFKAVEWSNFLQTHKLPLTRKFPWLERFPPIRWYNDSTTFKSVFVSTSISVGLNYLSRLLAYVTEQTYEKGGKLMLAESPNSADFFLGLAAMTSVEISGDTIKGIGARSLTQKGHLNYTSRSYLLWAASLLDTAMHGFMRVGLSDYAYITCGISFAVKAGIWAWGRIVDPKARKIVAISGLINRPEGKAYDNSDFDYVVKQHSMTEAITLSPEREEQLRGKGKVSLKDFASTLGMKNLPLTQVQEVYDSFFGFRGKAPRSLVHSCHLILGGR